MTDNRIRSGYAAFASSIFLSAFLLFQVQPLIGKYILPWFGGAPGVWTTCMLFFQVALFAGYAYAHLLIKYFGSRGQGWVHFAAIVVALFLLPIAPSVAWKPIGTEDPTWRILGLLASTIGLPYFLLSANGPLLQAWFSRIHPGVSPYGLYSLSNVGSLLGLVSYPFLVEPRMSVDAQTRMWSWGFVAFAIFCLGCALMISMTPLLTIGNRFQTPDDSKKISLGTYGLWFALPACGSIMLLATTNQVCLDVAAIPFLWVVPLMLYLMTFILSFGNPIWYPRRAYWIAFLVAIAGLCYILPQGPDPTLGRQIGVYFTALFICCMVCHGEMVLLKPHPSHLTTFYLLISAGGAAGGLFVGLLAPHLFHKYIELNIGMFACCVLMVLLSQSRERSPLPRAIRSRWALVPIIVGMLYLANFLFFQATKNTTREIIAKRNFYGVLRIRQGQQNHHDNRTLYNGQIVHGTQYTEEHLRKIPTTYYGEKSGVGLALSSPAGPRRVGIVGLGAGTLAVYGRSGDVFRFYDINPDVVRLANEYFSYLHDSSARIEHVLGDARLSLDRESPQQYDVLVVDAFSSDAIPTHLLTEEAFRIYLKHLRDDGLLVIHISNRHFDLEPVIRAAADHFQLWSSTIHNSATTDRDQSNTCWMVLARSPEATSALELSEEQMPQPPSAAASGTLWTDNFTDLFRTLK